MIAFTTRDRRFSLDLQTGLLRYGDRRVRLPKQQFDLLRYLLETRPGELITLEELTDRMWRGAHVNEGALTRTIHRLRQSLGETSQDGGSIERVQKRGVIFRGVIDSIVPSNSQTSIGDVSPSVSTIVERDKMPAATTEEAEANLEREFRYDNLFRIASRRVPFVQLIGSFHRDVHEYQQGDIDVHAAEPHYTLPPEFAGNEVPPNTDLADPKCRLDRYEIQFVGRNKKHRLGLTFSQITYGDYLKTGEHLDDQIPDGSGETFRDRYAPKISSSRDPSQSGLSNICGVGIFVITQDQKVLISRHSRDVIVLKGVLSYTASGTMDWTDRPDPFEEVARECHEEVDHAVKSDNVRLFSVGIDAKRLYYQFSFYEQSARLAQHIVDSAPNAVDFRMEMDDLIAVPFELDQVLLLLTTEAWEPAAAAALLTLCAKEFGADAVERALDADFVDRRWRGEMVAEWNGRALRPGEFAVMSARYPSMRMLTESDRYVMNVLRFIGDEANGKDVIEVGCGTGRLSGHLVTKCRKLTCLDLSEKMLTRHREHLGLQASLISYKLCFGQDYRTTQQHDVAIVSLVLIHNITAEAFYGFAESIAASANVIFLFEHVGRLERTTSATRTRTEAELLAAFHGFSAERREDYTLFEDQLVFLKLVRSAQP